MLNSALCTPSIFLTSSWRLEAQFGQSTPRTLNRRVCPSSCTFMMSLPSLLMKTTVRVGRPKTTRRLHAGSPFPKRPWPHARDHPLLIEAADFTGALSIWGRDSIYEDRFIWRMQGRRFGAPIRRHVYFPMIAALRDRSAAEDKKDGPRNLTAFSQGHQSERGSPM